jgi:uncharacterized protein
VNLYFDSSALVKRYCAEEASEEVLASWRQAKVRSTSTVAYAEILAAIQRKVRLGGLASAGARKASRAIEQDWPGLLQVQVSDELRPAIRAVLRRHALRGFDAIHLASALLLRDRLAGEVGFLCYDQALAAAARKEGLSSPSA